MKGLTVPTTKVTHGTGVYGAASWLCARNQAVRDRGAVRDCWLGLVVTGMGSDGRQAWRRLRRRRRRGRKRSCRRRGQGAGRCTRTSHSLRVDWKARARDGPRIIYRLSRPPLHHAHTLLWSRSLEDASGSQPMRSSFPSSLLLIGRL